MKNPSHNINAEKKNKKIGRDSVYLFALTIPFILLMLIFNYFPVYGWIYSFFDYKPGIPLSMTPFVGLRYYVELFTSSGDVVNALVNTLAMNFLGILVSPLPIIFAIMMNEIPSARFRKFVQTFTTLPNFISWVLVYSIVFALFSTEGLVNTMAGKLGLSSVGNPLGNESITWFFQTALAIWKSLGWNTIIYLAAIAGIDPALYEATKVDGAGRFRTIWHITIPGIAPTYFVLLLLNVSNMLSSSFDQYFVFYNPMVANKIEVLDYFIYRMGIMVNNYPLATAIGLFKTIVSVILLFTVNRISKSVRGETLI